VIRPLRGDFGASYVRNARKNLFDEAVSFNMAPSNLRYEEWYQFRDPMTFELRARGRATVCTTASICSSSTETATSAIFVFGGEGPSGILYARSRSARCA
jgi:hypothetical protein